MKAAQHNVISFLFRLTFFSSLAFCGISFSLLSYAAEEGKRYDIPDYVVSHEQASIKRGFETYMQFCASCHKSEFVRHKRISDDLHISWKEYKDQWLGGSEPTSAFLTNSWTFESAKEVFGIVPPDLSLIASQKEPNWVYRYLHSFYKDDAQLYGRNNVLAPNVKMPNVLAFMQGTLEKESCGSDNQNKVEACFNLVKTEQGTMTDQEFNDLIQDLVNFFVYLSEPSRLEAEILAPKVLLFLLVFCLIAYLLKREFWKDISK
ncbi:cytochrome c1 [Marinomonas mediterranea]|uniref:cytochrome c1 n=1 Tax=Marinomonas mediterranea TaxID=119864 RepID=UPI00234B2A7D|nr:cytochrome c1 [Marinomonas mediterranea]WCN09091.1 cytochrome c1 [Marinomonas mediterranea]